EACEASETGSDDFVCVTPTIYSPAAASVCAPNTYNNNVLWLEKTQTNVVESTVDHRKCTPAATYQAWSSPEMLGQQPDYLCDNAVDYQSPDGKSFALVENDADFGYRRYLPAQGWSEPNMTVAAFTSSELRSVH